MGDDTSDIRQFYDDSVEQEDGRLDRHQLECEMTWRYLDKYLPRFGKILEIGCAAGAYTVPLAKRGYNVTAVDFSPNLIKACRQKARKEKLESKIACVCADARELSAIADFDYDAALIMGPLYHLVLEDDRKTVIKQVSCHLKPGGVLIAIFISRYGIWNDVLRDNPEHIGINGLAPDIVLKGYEEIPPEARGKVFRGYFAAPEEIRPLFEPEGFKTLALAGIESAGVRDMYYSPLKGKQRQLWLDLLFSISAQPSIIGAANHLLYVGEKEG